MEKKSIVLGYYGYWVILTYLGVFSSMLGIYLALSGRPNFAIFCLMASGIFDMLDGPVARLSKRTDVEKNFGIQLDSLADIIGFGVLPSVIGFSVFTAGGESAIAAPVMIIIIFAYVLAGLIRLGYFNVTEMEFVQDKKRRKYYTGMPITFAAVIIPIIYSLFYYFSPESLPVAYAVMLVVLTGLYIMNVKLPKVGIRIIAPGAAIVAVPIIYMLLSR